MGPTATPLDRSRSTKLTQPQYSASTGADLRCDRALHVDGSLGRLQFKIESFPAASTIICVCVCVCVCVRVRISGALIQPSNALT